METIDFNQVIKENISVVGELLPVANKNQNGLQAKEMAPILGAKNKILFMRLKTLKSTANFIVAPNNYGGVGPVMFVSCDYFSASITRCNTSVLSGTFSDDLDAGVLFENGYCSVYIKAKNVMNIIPLFIPSDAEYVLQSVDTFPDDVIWSNRI